MEVPRNRKSIAGLNIYRVACGKAVSSRLHKTEKTRVKSTSPGQTVLTIYPPNNQTKTSQCNLCAVPLLLVQQCFPGTYSKCQNRVYQLAIDAINTQKINSVREASRRFDVTLSTLEKRLQGSKSHQIEAINC